MPFWVEPIGVPCISIIVTKSLMKGVCSNVKCVSFPELLSEGDMYVLQVRYEMA